MQGQKWTAAEAAAAKLVEMNPKDANAWFHLGYSRHAQEQYDTALEAHMKAAELGTARLKTSATYNVACVYALKEQADKAFAWLDKAIEAGFADLDLLKSDKDLTNLHADPRFQPLVERVSKLEVPNQLTVFSYTTPRQSARMVYFSGAESPGQVVIDYAPVPWAEKFAGALDDPRFVGARWRFGADAWTSLDTSIAVEFGDLRLEPGYYYLTLTHKGDTKCVINVLDPVAVRKTGLDPVMASATTGGQEIALRHSEVEGATGPLTITMDVDPRNLSNGQLVVTFGPHRLTAPMHVRTDE